MKYRTFGITVTPHGTGMAVVHSRRSGATGVFSRPQAQLLLACDTFKTLRDHAARNWLISKALEYASGANAGVSEQEDPRASVERQLQAFVADGFLVSDADLHEEIRALCRPPEDAGAASHKITSMGIPTRDRPESLRRALASYVENATRFERKPALTVVDDSGESGTQALNKEGLRAVQRRYGVDLRYANREQRARFAGALARRMGIPEDIPRFALLGDDRCPKTYGGCRNALLLDSAGEIAVQADDDTVCRIAAAPGAEAGLALISETDATEFWFFESFQDALAFAPPVEVDLLGVHEQLLGRTLADCVAQVLDAGEDLDFMHMEPPFLDNMRAVEAKVAVSFVGMVGDAGAPYSFRFLRGGSTFERMTETEQAYRLGMTTRQMVKAATRPGISDWVYCMTANIGLDHRALLPPFMPVLRNEDGVFGSILSAFFPGLYKGYLPYMVLHVPPEARAAAPDAHRTRYKASLSNNLLVWIIQSFRSHPSGPDGARNLRALGRTLQDLGALPQDDFADFLRTVACRSIGAEVAYVERQLEQRKGEAPSYWIDDVRASLLAAREAVMQPAFFVPFDLEGNAAERLALFQDLVYRFGELLVHWPDIVETAGALRAHGHRLSTTV